MGSRTWIKIYCDKWLNGTLREETPEFRGIWVDLLVLAGSGKYGDSGEIKITDQVGFLDQQLADLLQISVQKWVACKKKLIETDRVEVGNENVIVIKNWSKYQSEYRRQKPYRQDETTIKPPPEKCNQKLQQEVTEDFVTKSTTGERDKRLEIIEEEIRDSTPLNPPVSLSLEQVIEVYEKNICLNGTTINEETENQLKFAVDQFSAPWVIDAIREACLQNQPTLRYIGGILRTWRKEGKHTTSL
jgi:DnaD/phage-associated family protein